MAGGVFSNDDKVIEQTLDNLTSDQRAQFVDGQRISKLPSEQRQSLTPREKESQEFYNKMMDSFKSLHYFGAERKAEKYIDQTMHKGGTDVADKVAPIGSNWTNSNQVNAQAIESMDQRTFNTLMSGTRGRLDANGAVQGGIQGDDGKQYLSEFHKQMAGALAKNLGNRETTQLRPDGTEETIKYVDRAQNLLNEKIKEGVSINSLADNGNLAALRDKVPSLKNIPDEKFNELAAGHDLQRKINSGEIKEGDLKPQQAAQLDAYKKDTVLRPFMEGREVARQLNNIESGARAERLFAGRELSEKLTAAGQTPTAEQQKQIDFYKQNAKEIEGLTKNLTGQVIERQRDSFTKQLSREASESLQSYQKTLYDAVKQNTGRDIVQALKDNESMWGNDRKAMLDGVLSLNAATREKIKNDPEGYGKELRNQLKEKFSHGSENNAQYKLMDSLLKQVETSDKKVPDAPVMGAKEQLLAQAAGIDGYSNKDAVAIVSDVLKADKDGSLAAKLAADPQFKKAALESMHGDEAAYERQTALPVGHHLAAVPSHGLVHLRHSQRSCRKNQRHLHHDQLHGLHKRSARFYHAIALRLDGGQPVSLALFAAVGCIYRLPHLVWLVALDDTAFFPRGHDLLLVPPSEVDSLWSVGAAIAILLLFNLIGHNRDMLKSALTGEDTHVAEFNPGMPAGEKFRSQFDTQDFATLIFSLT